MPTMAGSHGISIIQDHHCIAIGALIIRIGFWSPLYQNYDKEPPAQKKIGIFFVDPHVVVKKSFLLPK